jgi:hypothetical protein
MVFTDNYLDFTNTLVSRKVGSSALCIIETRQIFISTTIQVNSGEISDTEIHLFDLLALLTACTAIHPGYSYMKCF